MFCIEIQPWLRNCLQIYGDILFCVTDINNIVNLNNGQTVVNLIPEWIYNDGE